MAEDGTGGARLPQARRTASRTCSSRATSAATGWRRSASTPKSPSPRAGRASAPPNGGELVVVWATPFATEQRARSTSCSARRSGPAARRFGPAMIVDPDIREGDGHEPRSGDELDRPGRRRLPRRQRQAARRSRCCAPATCRGACASLTSTANAGRRSARSTATRAISMRPPTRGQRAADRDRPDRQRRRRLAGARNRRASRASGRGACSGAALDYVMPVSAATAARARRSTTTPTPPASRSRGSARPRSPTARRRGRARRCPARGSSSTCCPTANRTSGPQFAGAGVADTAVAGGTAATVGRAEHRHRRTAGYAPALRQQRHAARGRGQRHGLVGSALARPAVRRAPNRALGRA